MRKFSKVIEGNDLEWGRFYSKDVEDFLDYSFIEYTNPMDKRYIGPANTYRVKSGTNMMVFYVVEIPVKECQLEVLVDILEDLKVMVERVKARINIGYSVKLIEGSIKLTLWSKDKS